MKMVTSLKATLLLSALALLLVMAHMQAAQAQDEPDAPNGGIVDLNALPDPTGDLDSFTQWNEGMPDDDDWNGPGLIVWQRADIEADRRAVDAVREQTRAIVAQTEAMQAMVTAQQQQNERLDRIAEAIENIQIDTQVSMPEEVTQSLVPALDAIREWIRPTE